MTAEEGCPGDGGTPYRPVPEPAANIPPGAYTAYRDPDGRPLNENDAKMLAASGIPPEHTEARGYETVHASRRLEELGFVKAACKCVPGLLIPMLRADGSTWGYQYRPDIPRWLSGKPIKYETPYQQRNGLDIPPGVGPMLADPSIPLFITEGAKKADCGVLHGLCIVALVGVWGFLGTNSAGGKMALPEFRDIALNDGRRVVISFDGDIARKESVQKAAHALAAYLATKGAHVEFLHLPDTDAKTGLDDYLMGGHTVEDLWHLVKPHQPRPHDKNSEPQQAEPKPKPEPVAPVALGEALAVFSRWLHIDDTAPVLAVAAVIVANLAEGDPVWLLIVGPPSGGKTEILVACSSLPYMVPAATITEAALLSGTARRERADDATGGLLRQVGEFGVLLAKDFTSVLSQNRDTAKQAMAALREIYDGRWDRPVGTDGGRTLHWRGKCGFIGGVTPSYDRYGTIVNTLGDRFLLLRMPDVAAAEQAKAALKAAQHENQMRTELAAAMTGLIAGADRDRIHEALDDDTVAELVRLASFAACARTVVERDGYTGELLVLPQPEGPARLVKAMRRLYGGLGALGVDDATRWAVLTRVAVDCAPAMRVPLMEGLLNPDPLKTPPRRTADIAEEVGMVSKTAGRVLDDLTLLGMVTRDRAGGLANSADRWTPTDWLREHWPKARQKTTTQRVGVLKEEGEGSEEAPQTHPLRTSLSHSEGDPSLDGHHHVKQTDREAAAAYVKGLCKTCHDKPYRVGGTQCEECFQADRDALNLVFTHLGATPVDEADS
jgi:hypothetical protein